MSCAAFVGASVATSSTAPPPWARRYALSTATRAGGIHPGRPESVAWATSARTDTTAPAAMTAANATATGARARPRAASAAPTPRDAATAGVIASR
jgi:hypothetical protein